jgi:hypothetical protein
LSSIFLHIYTTQTSVTRKRGSSTPIASFGGRANSRIGTLNEPKAPPKPALEMETASTASTAKNQKYSGEVSNISKPFIDGIYISSFEENYFF